MIKSFKLSKIFTFLFIGFCSINYGQTVNTLSAFRTLVAGSNNEIKLEAGDYNLEDLPEGSRVIDFAGSNNIVDLTGAHIQVPVGCIKEAYFKVTGNHNVIKGGEIEDVYRSGLQEVTDFSAYNQDRENLAFGLRGAAVMPISGTDNLIDGLKLTVRGSYPYGYGSIYGIGSDNVYGLDKRCGILIKGPRNTINNVEVQQRAFGHGIYMQGDADETVIKNTLVEGRVRETADLYNETNTYDLPYRSDYKLPLSENNDPIPTDEVHSLCEDAFRMYSIPGTITIDNCIAKKMRGGFRLYLGGAAQVSNSTAIDCGSTNYNLPSGGRVINSSGNFAYAPLSDYRLSRNSTTAEWTILPSPNAMGPHNIMDLQGSNHNIIFRRNPGPIDETDRAIVVTGNNSVIINETEYKIILEANTSGNKIFSCGGGAVVDNGTNNEVTISDNCEEYDENCPKTAELMEAECYDLMSGIQTGESSEGGQNVGYINGGDWLLFRNIDLTGQKIINARIATKYNGGYIEVRKGAVTGELLATVPVANTGGWQNWISSSVELDVTAEGKHDIYFVFKGTRSGYLFNVNWFSFSKVVLSVKSFQSSNNIKVQPNPFYNTIDVALDGTALNTEKVKITLFSFSGQKLRTFEKMNQNKNIQLDMFLLEQGVYLLKIESGNHYVIKRIVKQ